MPQPTLDELMSRFLATKAPADAASGEVEPHEVAGGFRATAAVTWAESLATFKHFGVDADKVACPPEWAAFAALEGNTVAVPLVAGLFPQRVRQVPSLLATSNLCAMRSSKTAPVPGFSSLRSWLRKALASKSPTMLLVATGVAVSLGDWADAEAALAAAKPLCQGSWLAVWENQSAAIRWLKGETATCEGATFNRGIAALFAGDAATAQGHFREATKQFPETSGWNHLAGLYLALATARVGK